jgi:branched-chain amino acid transport system substrate-binding protein
MKKIIVICLIVLLYLLIFSKKTPDYYSVKRDNYLSKADKVYIGVIWPFNTRKDFYREGVLLAQKQINEKGGILGKKLYLDFFSYHDIKSGMKAVRKVVTNEKYSAAVGFNDSALTSRAEVVCEMNGLLIMSNGAIESKITEHRFRFIFRNIANIKIISKAMLAFLQKHKFKKISIVYNTKDVSRNIVRYLMEYIEDFDIKVISTYLLSPYSFDYREDIADVRKLNPDVLVFAISRKQAIDFVEQMHELGCDKYILATDTVDDKYFLKRVGNLTDKVYTYSMFSPYYNSKEVREFVDSFKKEYGKEPDTWAALGYDSIKVLAYTMEKVKSIKPFSISSMLAYISWSGALGEYSFNINGDVVNKKIFFKKIKNKKFIFLEEYYALN